jgi:hypothetical protein
MVLKISQASRASCLVLPLSCSIVCQFLKYKNLCFAQLTCSKGITLLSRTQAIIHISQFTYSYNVLYQHNDPPKPFNGTKIWFYFFVHAQFLEANSEIQG